MNKNEMSALIAKSQKTMADFLKADLKLGIMYAELSKTEAAAGNAYVALRSFKQANRVLDSVEKSLPRASSLNPQVRKQIDDDFAKLKAMLDELSP